MGRGTAIFLLFALLFGVLLVTFAGLFRSSRSALREDERRRRVGELEAASEALGARLEAARLEADTIASRPEVAQVLGARDELAAAVALRRLDLSRVGARCLAVELVRDGATVARWRRDGLAPLPGPSDAFAPDEVDPLLVRAEAARLGDVAAALLRSGPDEALLRVAMARGQGTAVVVEVDAGPAARTVRAAAGAGPVALVDAEGRLVGDAVADAVALELAPGLVGKQGTWAELEGDSVTALVPVRAADRAGGWRLVARAPLAGSAAGLTADLLKTLVLAAVGMGLVLAIALSSARGHVREAAAREREGYLRLSLDETARNERFLQSMFDAITDVVVVQDTSYRITHANRVARDLYGERIVGRACHQVYRGKDSNAKCKNCPADATVLSKRPTHVEMKDPRTDEVWQIANYPVLGADGEVKAIVEHARNVTDTRRLERQLVQSEKLSTLGEMAAGVAHEINNPIGVISMFAQLLAEEVKDSSPSAHEKVKTIEQHAESVGAIVRDLLRFSRKSTGDRAVVDARQIVERALAIVEHQRALRDVTLVRELDAAAFVLGEEGPLAQVVLNLVVNAIHAMAGKGTLTVTVRAVPPEHPSPPGHAAGDARASAPGGPRVWIQVRDTGKGIEPRHLRRIFEPFFTTKPAGQGTGLGLSVSFGIVHRDHQGAIWVDSEEGKGALFTVELPAAPAAPAPEGPPAPTRDP